MSNNACSYPTSKHYLTINPSFDRYFWILFLLILNRILVSVPSKWSLFILNRLFFSVIGFYDLVSSAYLHDYDNSTSKICIAFPLVFEDNNFHIKWLKIIQSC